MQRSPLHEEGLTHQKNRANRQAIEAFSQALETEPKNPDLYNDRAVSYLHNKQLSEALFDMNKALELDPDYAYRYAARAYVKDALGDLDGAIEDYRIAVKMEPDDDIALNNLGLLEEKKGYQKQAEKHFKKADEISARKASFEEMFPDFAEEQQQKNQQTNTPNPEPQTTNSKLRTPNSEPHAPTRGDHIREMLKVFTQKEAFKDFLRFVKNGFKDKPSNDRQP